MTEQKITCCICGLDYLQELIKIQQGEPYCELCHMEFIIEQTQKEHELYIPSYFLSNSHLQAFLQNMQQLPEIFLRSPRDVLSAYIHSIPALHYRPTLETQIFDLYPFMWQFELIIIDYNLMRNSKTGTKVNFRCDLEGRFKQSLFVSKLGKDLQIILYAAHLLTINESSSISDSLDQKFDEIGTSYLNAGFKKVFEEMKRFYIR